MRGIFFCNDVTCAYLLFLTRLLLLIANYDFQFFQLTLFLKIKNHVSVAVQNITFCKIKKKMPTDPLLRPKF